MNKDNNNAFSIVEIVAFNFFNLDFISKKNKLVLDRHNRFEKIKVKFSTDLIDTVSSDEFKRFTKKVKFFVYKLKRSCPNFNPSIFIENFRKTLFDISKVGNKVKRGVVGEVDFGNENIKFKLFNMNSSYHELLHLSSQKSITEELWMVPIIEGYTELLNERYFKSQKGTSYPLETLIMSRVELIIGKNILEQAYFTDKMQESMIELGKYETAQNIAGFIKDFYRLFLLEQKDDLPNNVNEIQVYLNKIFIVLFNCFKNKVNSMNDKFKKLSMFCKEEWIEPIKIYHKGNLLFQLNLLDEKTYMDFYNSIADENIIFDEISNKKRN